MNKWISRSITYIWSLFLSGLFALLPIALTIALFHFMFVTIKSLLEPIASVMPAWSHIIPHSEILVALLIIFAVGVILRLFVINALMHVVENFVYSIPLIKPVYASIKQLVKTFDSKEQGTFKKVVLVEFPHKGSYSIGFLTGQLLPDLAPNKEQIFFNIFVPATPNPTSGFYIIVPEKDVTIIDLNRQEAMTLILSAGIILPERFK